MRIASTIGATSLHHDGVDYTPDERGMFEVPQHAGEHLTNFPHWVTEADAVDQRNADAEQDRLDVSQHADRIATLEVAVAGLTKDRDDLVNMVADLESRLTAKTGRAGK